MKTGRLLRVVSHHQFQKRVISWYSARLYLSEQGRKQAKMLDSSGHCAKAQVCVNLHVMCTPHKHAQTLNVYIGSYLRIPSILVKRAFLAFLLDVKKQC